MKPFIQALQCLTLFACVIYCHFLHPDSDEENRIKTHFLFPALESLDISDWKNPTYNDYVLIQNHLEAKLAKILQTPISLRCFKNDRLNTELHGWITYRLGRTMFVDDNGTMPIVDKVYFNNDPNKKDKCIICYASYNKPGTNRDYTRGIYFIMKALEAFGYDGHFIYQIGGWPNLAKDRLKYADVPYAFKPFFFEEIRDMGYTKILWLDSACVPIASLDPIFKFLEKNGCCFFGSGSLIRQQELDDKGYVLRSLELPKDLKYNHILTQVVGFDLSHPKASHLLDRWIEAAEKKVPFLEPSGDQLSFAFLAAALGLSKGHLPNKYYLEGTPYNFKLPKRYPKAIIYHQYDFLTPNLAVPEALFSPKKKKRH